jgi:hypothetical protein
MSCEVLWLKIVPEKLSKFYGRKYYLEELSSFMAEK